MNIRNIIIGDADKFLDMLLNLDNETKFMMFEKDERNKDISVTKEIIENSIQGDNLLLVATDNEEIVGFLSAERGKYKRIRHSAYIVIGIREKFRGKNIGSRLFSELDIWARKNNITRLELSVICSNVVAKHLYEKNGFEVEGIKKNSMIIDNQYVDEFYMAKLYN